jgi:hypothetical protein
MALADLGANVLRIARPARAPVPRNPVIARGRTATLTLDLKKPADVIRLLGLVEGADALIEGFRPNVRERLVSERMPVSAATRAWSMEESLVGAARARWHPPPATTSTTLRSPARSTPVARRSRVPCRR